MNFTKAVEADANGIVVHKHVPYMIHPNARTYIKNPDGTLTMTTTTFSISNITIDPDDYSMTPEDMFDYAVKATDPDGNEFTFVGFGHNYNQGSESQVVTPQNSYFLGTAAGETYPRFWMQAGTNERLTGSAWRKNTAIVLPPSSTLTYKDNRIIYNGAKDALDYVENNDSYSYINYVCPEYGVNTDSGTGSGVKSMNIVFTNNPINHDADAIDIIEKDSEKDTQVPATYKNKIFNMSGQLVGTSAEGLEKGIYIMNGKKFIVR